MCAVGRQVSALEWEVWRGDRDLTLSQLKLILSLQGTFDKCLGALLFVTLRVLLASLCDAQDSPTTKNSLPPKVSAPRLRESSRESGIRCYNPGETGCVWKCRGNNTSYRVHVEVQRK